MALDNIGRDRWLVWLGAAGIAILLAGLALPLTDGDSAFYATVARDALKSGEWITFYTRGGGVFDKPPLTIWLLGLSMAAFGATDGAVRIWHLVLDRPKWPRAWLRHTAAAVSAFLIVAAPWFVAAGLRQGRAFVDTFFLSGSLGIGRFFHPALSSPSAAPAWTGLLAYVIFMPLGTLPWTGWLWPGLRDGWQARAGGPSVFPFCAVWAVTVLAVFNLSPGGNRI